MARRGRLIVFEGGEGSGKSTQARLLSQELHLALTREPGGTAIGESIRALLLDPAAGPLAPRSELLLMAAARAQHVAQHLEPLVASGRHVVCDRYSGSTLAYQGYGRRLPLEAVRSACAIAEAGLEPDLVILLDVPFEIGLSRRRDAPDRIEQEAREFFERVADGYRTIAADNPTTWVVLDGTKDAATIQREVQEVVLARLSDLSAAQR